MLSLHLKILWNSWVSISLCINLRYTDGLKWIGYIFYRNSRKTWTLTTLSINQILLDPWGKYFMKLSQTEVQSKLKCADIFPVNQNKSIKAPAYLFPSVWGNFVILHPIFADHSKWFNEIQVGFSLKIDSHLLVCICPHSNHDYIYCHSTLHLDESGKR